MKLLPHWVSRPALAALVAALAIGAVLPKVLGWSVYSQNQVWPGTGWAGTWGR